MTDAVESTKRVIEDGDLADILFCLVNETIEVNAKMAEAVIEEFERLTPWVTPDVPCVSKSAIREAFNVLAAKMRRKKLKADDKYKLLGKAIGGLQ